MAYNYLKKIADFYPRPPRGGRPENYTPEASWSVISIHALREEGDAVLRAELERDVISIHALREEGDHDLFHSPGFVYEFLSTPSARRATRGD